MPQKTLVLTMVFFAIVFATYGQTKKISYKSHSGSAANYSTALAENLFDMDNSNFGVAPTKEIVEAQLDSVIFICDTVALMVTSRFCKARKDYNNSAVLQKLWKAGRDSVFYHPLFSKKHSLDSIKAILQMQYYFRNPISKVVFVGYDNTKDSCKSSYPIANAIAPPSINRDVRNGISINKQLYILFTGILLFAGLFTGLAWLGFVHNKTPFINA
ncbi:MAG: hypothetical protein IPP48_00535 [Chitinophagaceae bacterium]|nr:hypothetical protein [Chitinophagaceae bacterium]